MYFTNLHSSCLQLDNMVHGKMEKGPVQLIPSPFAPPLFSSSLTALCYRHRHRPRHITVQSRAQWTKRPSLFALGQLRSIDPWTNTNRQDERERTTSEPKQHLSPSQLHANPLQVLSRSTRSSFVVIRSLQMPLSLCPSTRPTSLPV